MRIQSLTGICVVALLSVSAYGASLGSTAVVNAAKNQDWEAVRALISQHADLSAAEPDGTTALHWAAHWNNLDTVKLLIQAGANVKAANRYDATPISEAVVKGSAALIEELIKAGADPNTHTTSEGETVLMTASRDGNAEAVKVLLEHGAKPNETESALGQTALMWAAAEGHAQVIQLLLAHEADPDLRSADRDTTLPKLPAGTPIAPINRGGLTALHFAARQGQMDSLKALLDGGVNINQGDVDGNSALVFAILNSHFDLAQYLLDRGADPNVVNKNGRAALFVAVDVHDADRSPRPARVETNKLTSMDMIKLLVDRGANINQQLTGSAAVPKFAQDLGSKTLAAGGTPLMRAARSADVELVHYLLDHGANPKLAGNDGLTALMVAAGTGGSPAEMTLAKESKTLETVKLFADLGLDVNAKNDKGDTALHGAASKGLDSVVKFLAEKGAKINARNKRGFTPLDISLGKQTFLGNNGEVHESTAALIKQLGGEPGKEVKVLTAAKATE
jgi:ankyrin repeat protein